MTGDEIFEQLKFSERWGGNQPSIYLVTAILEELPVSSLAVNDDTLQLSMTRDLTISEMYLLRILKPDEFFIDGYDFSLWWD